MDRLILVDGHNLLFRMFYGIPRPVYNEDGRDIKAVMGFVGGITKLITSLKADRIMVVFDSESSTADRVEDYEDYKKNRVDYSQVPDDENPFVQLPDIFKVLKHLNVSYQEVKDYEADDYIASIARQYSDQYEIVIVSTDSDFNQLVSKHITIFNPRGKDGTYYDEDKVYEKLGVYPNQIIDYKSLVGDSADNITGVKGIGPKRAVEILQHGTIDALLNEPNDLADKYKSKLFEFEDIIRRNQRIITMYDRIPIDLDDEVIKIHYDVKKRPMAILSDCGIR